MFAPLALYMLALGAYVAFACLVWCVCLVLPFSSRTRTLGFRIAAAMLGSFPGVFLFQMLSVPKIGAIALLGLGLVSSIGPSEFALGIGVGLGLTMFANFAIASTLGFYVGWRLAWEIASGRSVRELITSGRLVRPIPGGLRSSVA